MQIIFGRRTGIKELFCTNLERISYFNLEQRNYKCSVEHKSEDAAHEITKRNIELMFKEQKVKFETHTSHSGKRISKRRTVLNEIEPPKKFQKGFQNDIMAYKNA